MTAHEIKTFVLIATLVVYLCTIVIGLSWYYNKKRLNGLLLFFLGFASSAIGSNLAYFYGSLPQILTVFLANILMFATFAFMAFGMAGFLGINLRKWPYLVYSSAFAILYYVYTFVQPDVRMRIMLFSGMAIPICIHIIYLIFNSPNPEDKSHASAVNVVYILFGILNSLRFYFAFMGDYSAGSYYAVTMTDNTLVTFTLLLLVSTAFSLQLMINKRLFSEVVSLAVTDPLTGLFNRRKTEELLKQEIERNDRYGTPFSVLLADIDHFKDINDSFGHDVGDRAIVHVTNLLTSNTRKADLIGRWGGEEFIIILPELDANEARLAAGKLVRKISENRFDLGKEDVGITVSIGVAEFEPKSTVHTLIKNADRALYQAKAKGRNCFESCGEA